MNSKYVLKFRRQRERKTNYKLREHLLVSERTRVVIRRSVNGINVQLIKYNIKGDEILAAASSRDLKKFGWNASKGNIPAAYLTGYLCGLKAKKVKIKHAIVDVGMQTNQKGTRIFATIKGLIDAGLELPYGKGIFPSEERIKGLHIENFAKSSKTNFSKVKSDSEKISKIFEKTKKQIEAKIND